MTSLTPEMIERAVRAMEPGAFARFDAGYTNRNRRDERAFLNAERTVKSARRKAEAALTAALSCPEGFKLVPVEPTAEMLDRAVAFALNVSLSGEYNWSAYMRDVWRTMLAASPAPAVVDAGWRPIASFPKDGELYLVCDDRSLDGDHQVVFWDEDLETPFNLHTPDGPAFHEVAFTHWRPLPSAPSQDAPQPISQDQDRG